MEKEVKVGRVSTPEQFLEGILEKMPRSISIVLFGADCDLKNEVYRWCVEQIPDLATGFNFGDEILPEERLETSLHVRNNLLSR